MAWWTIRRIRWCGPATSCATCRSRRWSRLHEARSAFLRLTARNAWPQPREHRAAAHGEYCRRTARTPVRARRRVVGAAAVANAARSGQSGDGDAAACAERRRRSGVLSARDRRLKDGAQTRFVRFQQPPVEVVVSVSVREADFDCGAEIAA